MEWRKGNIYKSCVSSCSFGIICFAWPYTIAAGICCLCWQNMWIFKLPVHTPLRGLALYTSSSSFWVVSFWVFFLFPSSSIGVVWPLFTQDTKKVGIRFFCISPVNKSTYFLRALALWRPLIFILFYKKYLFSIIIRLKRLFWLFFV